MRIATVRSVCECQARLVADIDDEARALLGRAVSRGEELVAPTNAVHRSGEYFDVGWQCPFCGRNTLRMFYKGAVAWREVAVSAA